MSYRLHPPMLRSMGLRRKISIGPLGRPTMRMLAKGKVLRGRRIDPFGRAAVRKLERDLRDEYEAAVSILVALLSDENHHEAVRIASLPDQVRGYEHLKVRRATEFREEFRTSMASFTS